MPTKMELQAQIVHYNKVASGLNVRIDKLTKTVEEQAKRIDNLSKHANGEHILLTELAGRVNYLSDLCGALNKSIDKLTNAVGEHAKRIDSLSEHANGERIRLTELSMRSDKHASETDNLIEALQAGRMGLTNRAADIEAYVNAVAMTDADNHAALNSRMDGLEGDLIALKVTGNADVDANVGRQLEARIDDLCAVFGRHFAKGR